MALAAAIAIAGATAANATVTIFGANLAGSNEVPGNASAGTGFATVTFDDVLNTLRVQAVFSGLSGPTTAAHIHCCGPVGANRGVATTTPSFPGFPLGVTSGVFDNIFDLGLASTYNPSFVTANGGTLATARAAFLGGLFSGNTYFNVHTTAFPGGEIRGQLAAVPEPASWAMMIGGFGLVGSVMRYRRRRMKVTYA
jgi:hypothetical protein